MALELDFGSEFLDHTAQARGSGYLKNWKEDGSIVVWVHPEAPVYSLWSHSWHRHTVEKDKETDEEFANIRGMRVNCLEPESILKKQRWRDDNDEREVPPAICPHCKVVEWVRSQVIAGELEWSTPIFKFDLQDDNPLAGEEVVIYAGGFCGLFQKRNLTRDEQAQVRKAGVKLSEAYMQNGYPRQQYVMAVASEADLDAGWVIAIEGQTLGDKMKKCIRDEIKRCGGDIEQGHPKYNPYPFEWTYDENKEFSDKYDVVALSRMRPKEKVRTLLESDHPDFNRIVAPPKLGSLRKSMEAAALIHIPFDELFEAAIEKYGEEYEDEAEAEAEPQQSKAPDVGRRQDAEAEPEAEAETEEAEDEEEETEEADEEVGCDVCGAPMAADELVCGKCGAEYVVQDDGTVILKPKPKVSKKTGGKAPRKHADARESRRSKARAALSKGDG